jgi:hypothetical protein
MYRWFTNRTLILSPGLVALALAAVAAPAPARPLAAPDAAAFQSAVRAALPFALVPPQAAMRLRQGPPPQQSRRFQPNYPVVPTVFGSDYGANVVKAYKWTGGLLGTLVDPAINSCQATPFKQPAGMWVDKPGRNLWVANFGSQDVRRFAPGSTTSNLTLRDIDSLTGAAYEPIGVSYDSYASGNLYVGNYVNTAGKPGDIEVWKPAQQNCNSAASYYLFDQRFQYVYFVANDRAGNLYVDYADTAGVGHVCFITAANATAGPSNNICGATGDFVSTVSLGYPGGLMPFRAAPADKSLGVVDQLGSAPSLLGLDVYHPLPLLSSGPAEVPCTTINPGFSDPVTWAPTVATGIGMFVSDATAVPGGELIRVKTGTGACPPTGPGVAISTIAGFTQLFGTAVSPSYGP